MSFISSNNTPLRTELIKYGWSDLRYFPIDTWVERLLEDGIEIFDTAEKFLTEFGGLRFTPERRMDAAFGIREIDFDAEMAGIGELRVVKQWADVLKEPTYPIGELDGMMLLISKSGGIYLNSFGMGKKVGDSVESALELIIFRRSRTEEFQFKPYIG